MKFTCLIFALMLCGCSNLEKLLGVGGGGTPKNAVVSGPYAVVLTSTKGNATTDIYANMVTQSSTSFSGTPNPLVCPGNVAGNCVGNDPQVSTDALTGTVSGKNVKINVSYTNALGTDTITLTGTVSNTNISGTYSDSQGDAGTWTATQSSPLAGTFSGSINSTVNPLTIPPVMTAIITEGQNFTLTGTATIQNWQCFASLDFSSGVAIGGAFTLSDSANNFVILGVPSGAKTFNVEYQVSPSALACAGDHGTGTLTLP